MIKNSFIISAIVLITACDKGVNEYEKGEMSGRVFLNDTINRPNFLITASGADVYYSKDNSIRNFLFKTVADNGGYFNFSHTRATGEDILIGSDTVDGILFEGSLSKANFLSSVNKELVLYPVVQNGLKVTVFDSLNTQVNKAEVCIYSSRLAFLKDSCALGIRNQSSNENGIAFFNNLVARDSPYFFIATIKIDTMIYKGKGEAVISNLQKGTISKRINLVRVK